MCIEEGRFFCMKEGLLFVCALYLIWVHLSAPNFEDKSIKKEEGKTNFQKIGAVSKRGIRDRKCARKQLDKLNQNIVNDFQLFFCSENKLWNLRFL
jgi:hypothetical protein